ncbi:MAG: nucleoside hydrolase [Myxococcota bacterium]
MLVIDTDLYIDDVLCLALLPYLGFAADDVIITTVGSYAPVTETANRAAGLVQAMAFPAPVFRGADAPWKGLGELPPSLAIPQPSAAIPSIHEATARLESHPGPIDILGIGPSTNLPLLFDAIAPSRIGRITLMTGAIFDGHDGQPEAEFNAARDPEALQDILRSGLPITLVPLDLCNKVQIPASRIPNLEQLGTIGPMLISAHHALRDETWAQAMIDGVVPYDAVALLVALYPERFLTAGMQIQVLDSSSPHPGAFVAEFDDTSPVRVALGGDIKWARKLLSFPMT